MGIVCLAGNFAVFLLLAWTLCRAAGWEKEREDLEQEQYLKEWREKKLKKIEKIRKVVLTFGGWNAILTKSVGDTDKKQTDKKPMRCISSAWRAYSLQA